MCVVDVYCVTDSINFSIVIAFFYHSNKKMFEFKLAFMLHVMYVINHILDIVDKWSYVS